MLLATADEEEALGDIEVPKTETEEANPPLVSLNPVVGFTNPHAMKMVGSIGAKEVVVMIDLRAMHNFISTCTVTSL